MIIFSKYSFRLFLFTYITFVMVNYHDLLYPLYISGPLCLAPWLIYDLLLPDSIASCKYTGIIFESVSILSAMLLINVYFFSGFLILIFFKIFRVFSHKIGLFLNAGILLIFILAKLVQN